MENHGETQKLLNKNIERTFLDFLGLEKVDCPICPRLKLNKNHKLGSCVLCNDAHYVYRIKIK